MDLPIKISLAAIVLAGLIYFLRDVYQRHFVSRSAALFAGFIYTFIGPVIVVTAGAIAHGYPQIALAIWTLLAAGLIGLWIGTILGEIFGWHGQTGAMLVGIIVTIASAGPIAVHIVG